MYTLKYLRILFLIRSDLNTQKSIKKSDNYYHYETANFENLELKLKISEQC